MIKIKYNLAMFWVKKANFLTKIFKKSSVPGHPGCNVDLYNDEAEYSKVMEDRWPDEFVKEAAKM
jgi:hypothetical protein